VMMADFAMLTPAALTVVPYVPLGMITYSCRELSSR